MIEYYNVLSSYTTNFLKTGAIFFFVPLIIGTFIAFVALGTIDDGKNIKYFKYIFIIYPIFVLASFLFYTNGKKYWEKILKIMIMK